MNVRSKTNNFLKGDPSFHTPDVRPDRQIHHFPGKVIFRSKQITLTSDYNKFY